MTRSEVLQPNFNVEKYLGKWYQIAEFPNEFEQGCTRSEANYSVLLQNDKNFVECHHPDIKNTLLVNNKCLNKDFVTLREISGYARPVNPNQPAALHVSFPGRPGPPDNVPNYLVHWTNYELAIVGSPDKKLLFFLARSKSICQEDYDNLVNKAKSYGYDTSKLNIDYEAVENCEFDLAWWFMVFIVLFVVLFFIAKVIKY